MMKRVFTVVFIAISLSACHKQTFDDQVLADVEHFNQKEAPKQLDPYTTFDSMAYDASNLTLTYFYTLNADVDASLFPTEEARDHLLDNLQNSIQMKTYKEHGLNFRYLFIWHETGLPLLDCTFTPDDYNTRSATK